MFDIKLGALSVLQILKNDIGMYIGVKRMKQIVGKWYISFLVVMTQFYIQWVYRTTLPFKLILKKFQIAQKEKS